MSSYATKISNVPVVSEPQAPITNDYCYCAVECDYVEKAFADLSDTADYRNDKSSFLFDKVTALSTVNIQLWKAGVKIADLNNNALGTYYDSFTARPNYRGYVVDWRLVAQSHGFGRYQIKAVQNIIGTQFTFESRHFRLLPFTDANANNTVKIVAYQDGNIKSNPLDYTGLLDGGWRSAYRVEGVFGFVEQEIVQDNNYRDSNYRRIQNRKEQNKTYSLETRLLPSVVADWLSEDASLANYLEISDYNIFNTKIFRDIRVISDSFDDIQTYLNKRRKRYVLKFQPYADNLIKTNF